MLIHLCNLPNPLRDKFMEFQRTEPCRASKEALVYRVMTVLVRKYKHY